jgi:hypothetical protein
MRSQVLCSGLSRVGMTFLLGLAACSSNSKSQADAAAKDGGGGTGGSAQDATAPTDAKTDAGCTPMALNGTPVLIDDMETTTNGPIQLDMGISAPLSKGYWYNSGANYISDAGTSPDMSTPAQGSFAFTALPSPTKTLDCSKTSAHAAHQSCVLNGLYDTCGVGFEFAQKDDPNVDAGAGGSSDGGSGGAGGKSDAGISVPKVTVPFDISRYKALTFWGKTTTPDPASGTMQVKISFPDTDTDPRGQICNGGGTSNRDCYNSYAAYFNFTTSWQQFTVVLDAGDGGVPPPNGNDGKEVKGIAIDTTWGNPFAKWIPTEVYGINWQAQRNIGPDEGPPLMTDIWIDDVYFVE